MERSRTEAGLLWTPSPERVANAHLTAFLRKIPQEFGLGPEGYEALHGWSVHHRETFWDELWSFAGVVGDRGDGPVLENEDAMPGARWYPDVRLSFVENIFEGVRRGRSVPGAASGAAPDGGPDAAPGRAGPGAADEAGDDAIVFWGEDRVRRRVSRRELEEGVFRVARALRDAGVGPGDRVAGFLPNTPETVMVALGTLAIGATWSSCSPDFGAASVLDRFGQIRPRVLFATDGYWYRDEWRSVDDRVEEIATGLPSLEMVVRVPYGGPGSRAGRGSGGGGSGVGRRPDRAEGQVTRPTSGTRGNLRRVRYEDLLEPFSGESFSLERFPFDHPLYTLFSSGTTGVPKSIVHGAGGTLLQHLKEHMLHGDVHPGDRVFYFTTCGWMMWNWLVSALAAGATLLLYDGSPLERNGRILFDLADEEGMTHFGTSAKFIDELRNRKLRPAGTHSLETIRTIFSTGSPLVPESFDFVYENISEDVCLSSISGGTDIVSCFVLGNPILPVWRGEIQCRGLGMAVEVFDEEGRPVVDEKGELVCTAPFPSMPLGFWDDPDGERYRAAYFEKYPGVWCHGDYARITPRGGVVIYGRSDTVLNPGGVRIGTAEIYRPVDEMPEILDSVAVGESRDGDVRIVLFVRLREDVALDEELIRRVEDRIRERASPRHVPAVILDVPEIPRTRSGKIAELAVRAVIHGDPVPNRHALANPESLDHFANRPELAS